MSGSKQRSQIALVCKPVRQIIIIINDVEGNSQQTVAHWHWRSVVGVGGSLSNVDTPLQAERKRWHLLTEDL
jgi:hypothetical protein